METEDRGAGGGAAISKRSSYVEAQQMCEGICCCGHAHFCPSFHFVASPHRLREVGVWFRRDPNLYCDERLDSCYPSLRTHETYSTGRVVR